MPKQQLSRIRRKAAAKVFYLAFHQLINIAGLLSFPHQEWEWDEATLFTDKEIAYIKKLQARINEDADLCRKLAWRLDGRKGN